MSIRQFLALVAKTKVVESLKSSSMSVKPHMAGGPSRSKPKYEDKKIPYSSP